MIEGIESDTIWCTQEITLSKMATLRNVARPGRSGHAAIYLRISHRSVKRFISYGFQVEERNWNAERGEVRSSHDNVGQLNAMLQERLAEARAAHIDVMRRYNVYTADDIKEEVRRRWSKEEHDESFFGYAKDFVEGYRKRGQRGSYRRFKVILNHFEQYAGQLTFQDLTPRLIRGFRTFLLEDKENKKSTVGKKLSGIRTITKAAIKDGLMDQADYPFFHITIKEHRGKKDKLTYAQIQKIEATEGSFMERLARDMFCFSFYACGMRFGDVCTLTRDHLYDGTIRYTMGKTEKVLSIPCHPKSKDIVERYDADGFVFPAINAMPDDEEEVIERAIDSTNTQVNDALKTVAESAKVRKHVTFHLARHSFANHARENGWTVSEISHALGHSSIQQTERYLASLEDNALDEKMRGLF